MKITSINAREFDNHLCRQRDFTAVPRVRLFVEMPSPGARLTYGPSPAIGINRTLFLKVANFIFDRRTRRLFFCGCLVVGNGSRLAG